MLVKIYGKFQNQCFITSKGELPFALHDKGSRVCRNGGGVGRKYSEDIENHTETDPGYDNRIITGKKNLTRLDRCTH